METLCAHRSRRGEAVRNQLSLGGILRAFLPVLLHLLNLGAHKLQVLWNVGHSTRRCWRCESAMWRRSFSTFASKHVRVAEIATTGRGRETGAARAAPSQPSSQPARRGDCRAYGICPTSSGAPTNSNSASRIHISSVAIDCGVKPVDRDCVGAHHYYRGRVASRVRALPRSFQPSPRRKRAQHLGEGRS